MMTSRFAIILLSLYVNTTLSVQPYPRKQDMHLRIWETSLTAPKTIRREMC